MCVRNRSGAKYLPEGLPSFVRLSAACAQADEILKGPARAADNRQSSSHVPLRVPAQTAPAAADSTTPAPPNDASDSSAFAPAIAAAEPTFVSEDAAAPAATNEMLVDGIESLDYDILGSTDDAGMSGGDDVRDFNSGGAGSGLIALPSAPGTNADALTAQAFANSSLFESAADPAHDATQAAAASAEYGSRDDAMRMHAFLHAFARPSVHGYPLGVRCIDALPSGGRCVLGIHRSACAGGLVCFRWKAGKGECHEPAWLGTQGVYEGDIFEASAGCVASNAVFNEEQEWSPAAGGSGNGQGNVSDGQSGATSGTDDSVSQVQKTTLAGSMHNVWWDPTLNSGTGGQLYADLAHVFNHTIALNGWGPIQGYPAHLACDQGLSEGGRCVLGSVFAVCRKALMCLRWEQNFGECRNPEWLGSTNVTADRVFEASYGCWTV